MYDIKLDNKNFAMIDGPFDEYIILYSFTHIMASKLYKHSLLIHEKEMENIL